MVSLDRPISVVTRTIYGLSSARYAPKFLSKTNRMGVPYFGVALSFLFSLLAYMAVSSSSAKVFTYFVNTISIAGLLNWACILVIHVRFMKACKVQRVDRKKDLAYTSPLQHLVHILHYQFVSS